MKSRKSASPTQEIVDAEFWRTVEEINEVERQLTKSRRTAKRARDLAALNDAIFDMMSREFEPNLPDLPLIPEVIALKQGKAGMSAKSGKPAKRSKKAA